MEFQPAWVALQAPLTSLPPLPPKRQVKESPASDGAIPESLRSDGRQLYETRRIFVKSGVIQKAEGSCYLGQGGTRLMCAVFGPKPNRIRTRGIADSGELFVEVTYTPFSQLGLGRVTRAGGGSGQASRNLQELEGEKARLASCIVEAFQSVVLLDRLPNSSVEIALLVLEDDGGLISAAMNCVSLALADAGIPMKDVCTAATVSVFDMNPHVECRQSAESRPRKTMDDAEPATVAAGQMFVVDPTRAELAAGLETMRDKDIEKYTSTLHLVLCCSDLSVAFLDAAGIPLESPVDTQLLQLAESACCETAQAFKKHLRATFQERQQKEETEAQLTAELISMVDIKADDAPLDATPS